MSRVHHVAVCSMEIPREAVTPADRMAQAAKLLKLAAERGAGWACLPELFATHYTAPTYRQQHDLASEKEVLEFLFQQSKSLRLNLVTSLVSRRGEAIFNTAVLVSREGDVAGRYDKTHLPQEERCIGVAAAAGAVEVRLENDQSARHVGETGFHPYAGCMVSA